MQLSFTGPQSFYNGISAVQEALSREVRKVVNEPQPGINVPFNKPYLTGNEHKYIKRVLSSGKLSGNNEFTRKCEEYFKVHYGAKECFLTSSCTDALEMSAVLLDIQDGDEVIVPSYTFVSTAIAFLMRGAKVIFADSREDHPGIDESKLESLITDKTKAIVVVHYGGVACDMDMVMDIAEKHGVYVVEDAAQAIDGYYKERPLGTIGHMATFSFHETKNIISGEGGMLVVNDDRFIDRAEIIREKGTDRTKFLRGEINKYGWVDIGSSYLPSDYTAAFLYAQLEQLPLIQENRLNIWQRYHNELQELEALGHVMLPAVPEYAKHNAHIFYLVLPDLQQREALRNYLKSEGVSAVFHYNPLHSSKYYKQKHDGRELVNCDKYDDCLLRLPMYAGMSLGEQKTVINKIWRFFLEK
ncbi:MAG: dTDP-4-amino-4,6-dideoxygalactose transaminase [Chitinophagales bacterium]|nr:dTDP-4-amino-4,6-dideoxygalactose transaminase [Chitinophagaceae bacterium]MCB9066081.1 dTDP-4-amino-4,6-dideoxygalactose transaminase [Chitinophagales bacterium]